MIGRVVLAFVLLAIAGATAGLQLDRQARYEPVYATFVPEPFRAFALPHRVGDAINAGQPQLGLAEAKQLVARRPMPALHLRLLSQAQFAAGDPQTATLTVQYAARRGWRDRDAQDVMLRLALSAGDKTEASRRFAALFTDSASDDEVLRALATELFSEPDGANARATFASILGDAERWQTTYLRKGPRVLSAHTFAAITADTAQAGTTFDCKLLQSAKKTLDKAADTQASEQLATVIAQSC
ncbi:MAG: hypothetical protein AAF127_07510 [Pseudomonadota bacterium]